MFFHEYFADFDRVFDESGTYNDRESQDFNPKLNWTLLRKVPILYKSTNFVQNRKKIFSHVHKKYSA